ncbi:MAG: hypothetical protein ACJ8IK_13280 [Burkholderiaceae bacterium]|jgi:hypothetical protein
MTHFHRSEFWINQSEMKTSPNESPLPDCAKTLTAEPAEMESTRHERALETR